MGSIPTFCGRKPKPTLVTAENPNCTSFKCCMVTASLLCALSVLCINVLWGQLINYLLMFLNSHINCSLSPRVPSPVSCNEMSSVTRFCKGIKTSACVHILGNFPFSKVVAGKQLV